MRLSERIREALNISSGDELSEFGKAAFQIIQDAIWKPKGGLRVLVNPHPRAGITSLFSIIGAGVFLEENPDSRIGIVTSTPAKAGNLRDRFRRTFPDLNHENVTFMPIYGSCCGVGFDYLVIDSPYQEQATLNAWKKQLADVQDAFVHNFYVRLAPNAACIVAHPRIAKDDLSGFLWASRDLDRRPNWQRYVFPMEAGSPVEALVSAPKFKALYMQEPVV